ncbi:MAG: CtsR family transcriptional regulator [Clostridia bacterium]
MRISDNVTAYILKLLDDENGVAEIKRNDLAINLGCVPSQINYVISSRFTPEQGYTVESRRGGGGFVRITRVYKSKSAMLMHIINSIGESLDESSTRIMLHNMFYNELISEEEWKILSTAVSDRSLSPAPKNIRDMLRASILKNILLTMGK